MSVDAAQAVALMVATMTTGLMAGVFGLYANTIMRGLGRTDDRTFVGAFQAIDRAIINPWFMASAFVGPALLAIAATVANLGRPALPWVAAALALYVITVVITIAVNVPLNDALKAAGDPDRIGDLGHVRERFDEARWAAWNLARVLTTTTAFGLLAWALVVHGRATA
jgi:uncharacterized membrane protein